jgi:hypothetical protein
MSVTEQTRTILDEEFCPNSVELEPMLDALAALDAAFNVVLTLNYGGELDGLRFADISTTLRESALGPAPEPDAEYEAWPALVEIEARSEEFAAVIFRELAHERDAEREYAFAAYLRERARNAELNARRTRDEGRCVA